ncbi:transglutaminase-like domain-containing protein [Alkalibacterium iburiense]|uniref:Transglutaminase-like domain-containing protein n=1 Tax=Alkalibacterium iburiense TaxID=290589 RepID=A0ABN0XCC9_9LACT
MHASRVISFLHRSLIAVLHTFMLIPVFLFFMTLNRVPHPHILLSFFLVTQVLAVLLYKWWLFLPVQLVHILYRLYGHFPSVTPSLTIREWMRETGYTISSQFSDLLEGRLTDVPELLIFSLLFLLISLLTSLAVHKKWALPSFLVPFSYLMIVHTFTDNRILSYMVLLVGFSFLCIAVMKMPTDIHWSHYLKNVTLTSLITFALVSLSSWGVDRFRSSQEWVEVQFYPYQRTLDDSGFFNWINAYSTGLGYQRTGFGLDDSVLGGPLHQDFTPLFRAYTDEPNYWKVMHRTEYTGSGWADNMDESFTSVSEPINRELLYPEYNLTFDNMRDEEVYTHLTIDWYNDVDYIAYPYGWSTFELDEIENDYALDFYERSSYYALPSELEAISHYSIYYDEQFPDRFDEERLSQDDGWRSLIIDDYRKWMEEEEVDEEAEMDQEEILAYFFEAELQIPDSLPQRVAELAEEITEGLDSEYEMVRAIEQYLKEDGGYRYSLLEVESSPEGEDYVDYFLFNSFIGYCDNFSTAMTMMLRTIGIPARWTKGFTPGNLYINGKDTPYYQVSNANAHSWVEVYFPSFGWVPFEPSPSFANPVTNPEPVPSISQESYVVEEEDYIDLEEIEQEVDPIIEEENASEEPTGSEELKGSPELTPYLSETSDDEREPSIDWSTLILYIFLLFMGFLPLFFLFRGETVQWGLKQLVSTNLLSLEKAIQLILSLFNRKKKLQPGQTIEDYLNQWKPFVPNETDTIDQFIALANVSFYSGKESQEALSSEQKAVILGMVDVYSKAPDLKRAKHKSQVII